ncbi:hypothetical protein Efla_006749 [Eimeria flavescens]
MIPKGPPLAEGGGPQSAASWFEGPPARLTVPRISSSPSPSNVCPQTPRWAPTSIDSGWVALLLDQLHLDPPGRGGAPSFPRVPSTGRCFDPSSSSSSSSSKTSSSSSSRDFLLQLLADEIMPQFLSDSAVQQLASLLLQQQTPTALKRAVEAEVARWRRLMGPPLSQGAPHAASSGASLSARGRLPSPPLHADEGGPLRACLSASTSPLGTPRRQGEPLFPVKGIGLRASPLGDPHSRAQGAPPSRGQGAQGSTDEFVTPGAGGPADASALQGGPPETAAALGAPCELSEGPHTFYEAFMGGAPAQPLGGPPQKTASTPEEASLTPAEEGPPGPPSGGRPLSSSQSSVTTALAAIQTAREKRRLRAPLSIDGETEAAIAAAFADSPKEGMTLEPFSSKVVGPLLGLGPFLAGPLFRRVDADNSGVITPEKLKAFWAGRLMLRSRDPSLRDDFPLPPLPTYGPPSSSAAEEGTAAAPFVVTRGSLVNFLGALARQGEYIYPEDLRPWVLEVAECAPDMAFLLDPQSSEYLSRYAGLLGCMYSYDHFYVFYYSFQELDEDEDFLLHRSDVCKYQGHSMSSLVEARLFSQVAHRFTCEKPHHLNFEDWIWFVLAYHEVTLPKALRFWFDIFDLDGDGCLRDHELEAAFESQAERLRMRDGKSQTYKEFICQVSDALGLPSSGRGISCRDFLNSPIAAGFLVNCLLKCEILRAFDDGEAVLNIVAGTPAERAVFFNFSPFELYAHAEYAAITAQRFEEQMELQGMQASGREAGLTEEHEISEED